MKMKTKKSIVLKRNMKNLMTSLLPMVKKMVNKKINQIKSSIMQKIQPNKRRNTLKKVSNRTIKSLENNFSVMATKNTISTPKIVIEKPQIVTKPKVVTIPKIVSKPKIAPKPKIVSKPKIVIEKNQNYDKYKNRVIRQLKKLFDSKKKEYIDYDDEEYRGIRDLEYLLEEVNENDKDYYKPERVRNAFVNDSGDYNYIVYESRGSKYYNSLEEYLSKIKPYLEKMIANYISIGEWKLQLTISIRFISSRNPEQFFIRHSYSENNGIMSGTDINDPVNNLLITLKEIILMTYQEWKGVNIISKELSY